MPQKNCVAVVLSALKYLWEKSNTDVLDKYSAGPNTKIIYQCQQMAAAIQNIEHSETEL